jgi:hypothetical protein
LNRPKNIERQHTEVGARRNFEFRDTTKHLLYNKMIKEKKVKEGEKLLSETWQSGETLVRI